MEAKLDLTDYERYMAVLDNPKKEPKEKIYILDVLDRCPVNVDMIKRSGIHKIITKFAKTKEKGVDKRVVEKSQRVREKWKAALKGADEPSQVAGPGGADQKAWRPMPSDGGPGGVDSKAPHPMPPEGKGGLPTADGTPPKPVDAEPLYSDKTRTFYYNQLFQVIMPFLEDAEKTKQLSQTLELAVFEHCEKAKLTYAKHFRERVMILKEKSSHPSVIIKILQNQITPEEFASKTQRELLDSNKLNELEAKEKDYTMKALQSDFYIRNVEVKDGEFKCGKCFKRKVLTYQKQMRSADEPMTTFFNCQNCGHMWKMN